MRAAAARHPIWACAALLLLAGIGMVLAVSTAALAVVFPLWLLFQL